MRLKSNTLIMKNLSAGSPNSRIEEGEEETRLREQTFPWKNSKKGEKLLLMLKDIIR